MRAGRSAINYWKKCVASLRRYPPRTAYYPGAFERHQIFVKEHPEAEQIGISTEQQLPWTLIAGVDPDEY